MSGALDDLTTSINSVSGQTYVPKRSRMGRRSLYMIMRLLKANHYRTDLSKATHRRASAIHRSQRPFKAKKPKAAAAKTE